jgi:hypothetical protein
MNRTSSATKQDIKSIPLEYTKPKKNELRSFLYSAIPHILCLEQIFFPSALRALS